MNDKINENSLREQFVQTVTEQVGKGVYVWGGNGEILDDVPDRKAHGGARPSDPRVRLLRARILGAAFARIAENGRIEQRALCDVQADPGR